MALLEKQLEVKRSGIPGAGKGLFTKKMIEKGTLIIEYIGTITTWKEVDQEEGNNAYIYYVNRNYVIDASKHLKAMARYANDARGLQRPKGFRNNSEYVKLAGKIYIKASTDIEAGDEILVGYGKEYWDVIRKNMKVDSQREKMEKKKLATKKKSK